MERLVLRERATGAHCVDVHCAYNVPRARPRSEPCGLRCARGRGAWTGAVRWVLAVRSEGVGGTNSPVSAEQNSLRRSSDCSSARGRRGGGSSRTRSHRSARS